MLFVSIKDFSNKMEIIATAEYNLYETKALASADPSYLLNVTRTLSEGYS